MVQPLKHGYIQPDEFNFRLTGPLTVETAPQLLEILQKLDHPNLRSISLDMTEVDEVDTSALATLVWSLHCFADPEIQINITGAPPKLGALMEIYQLEKMFLLSHN